MISRYRVSPDPAKSKTLTDMKPLKMKRELQSFLDIVNYLSKYSTTTAEVGKALRKLTSVNAIVDVEHIKRYMKEPNHWAKKTHTLNTMMS